MSHILDTAERASEETKPASDAPPYIIRAERKSKEDHAFVVAALKTVLEAQAIIAARSLAHVIAREGHARIACHADDPDVLLGFALFDKDPARLHYAFVKNELRKFGIGSALVRPEDVRSYSIKTAKIAAFKPDDRGWTHDPLKVIL